MFLVPVKLKILMSTCIVFFHNRWLIEINASPSLTASGKEDYDLKFGLLNDLLNVLDLENRLTGKEKRVGGWDLLWEDGPILADDGNMECAPNGTTASIPNSFLGRS